jgi:hypothetical protein
VFSTDDSRCRSIKGREKFSSVDEDDVIEIDYLLGGYSIVLWTLSDVPCQMMLFLVTLLIHGLSGDELPYDEEEGDSLVAVGLSLLSAPHAYDDGVLVTLLISISC